jgi:HSP20 family protein
MLNLCRGLGIDDREPTAASPVEFPVDVHATDSEYTLLAEMPGVHREEVTVKIEKGSLRISVESSLCGQPDTRVRNERREISCERSFTLPDDIHEENIQANMENGILTIILPRELQQAGRTIDIS